MHGAVAHEPHHPGRRRTGVCGDRAGRDPAAAVPTTCASTSIDLWIDCTGAGPDTSFLGNILERGFGHSPYGNRLQHIAGMQVVLASGEVLDTGFGHYPQRAHHPPVPVRRRAVPRRPVHPVEFRRGHPGRHLADAAGRMRQPFHLHACRRTPTSARWSTRLRPLRLDGTLRSIVHIGNDLRVISGGRVFPREQAGDQAPLPPALRGALRDQAGAGAWTVSGALYGSAAQVAAARAALRRALRGTAATSTFLTERKLRGGALLARLLGCVRRRPAPARQGGAGRGAVRDEPRRAERALPGRGLLAPARRLAGRLSRSRPTRRPTTAACCGCRRSCRCAAPTCWRCMRWPRRSSSSTASTCSSPSA